jgi:hypothetical protein
MNFGEVLHWLKKGHKVARSGWNGKGMWLMLVVYCDEKIVIDGHSYIKSPYIAMKTADGHFVPWLASQTDILADDWVINNGEIE